jgi:hypothetical protein
VVVYEDRASAIGGVEILVRSLVRYSPAMKVQVYSPFREIKSRLRDASRFEFINTTDLVGLGWNAKPAVLLRALAQAERVLWLDSDIVITGDISSLIARFGDEALIVGQEFRGFAWRGGQIRATGFGLKPLRRLPYAVNSGSIVAGRHHRELLSAWSALLSSKLYQEAQLQPSQERPVAFVGDQDALWALLTSEKFADLQVEYFRTGTDMIQHSGANGYHVLDRLSKQRPVFVHMLGRYKPWSFDKVPSFRKNSNDYLNMVCYELSPYFEAAKPFAGDLGWPEWLRRRTLPAKLLNLLFGGNVALRGLPLALPAWFAASVGRRPKL